MLYIERLNPRLSFLYKKIIAQTQYMKQLTRISLPNLDGGHSPDCARKPVWSYMNTPKDFSLGDIFSKSTQYNLYKAIKHLNTRPYLYSLIKYFISTPIFFEHPYTKPVSIHVNIPNNL
jgi:hypothetical protein